jgi:hypothetical protein
MPDATNDTPYYLDEDGTKVYVPSGAGGPTYKDAPPAKAKPAPEPEVDGGSSDLIEMSLPDGAFGRRKITIARDAIKDPQNWKDYMDLARKSGDYFIRNDGKDEYAQPSGFRVGSDKRVTGDEAFQTLSGLAAAKHMMESNGIGPAQEEPNVSDEPPKDGSGYTLQDLEDLRQGKPMDKFGTISTDQRGQFQQGMKAKVAGKPSKVFVPPPLPTDITVQEPGAGGISMSGSGPGGNPGDFSMGNVEQQIQDASRAQAAALRSQADLEGQRLGAQSKLQQQAIDAATEAQGKIQRTMEIRQQEVEGAKRAYERTVNAINDPSMVVDPNRFWNSRDTGQKILAGISILLGGLGQGTFAAMGLKSENGAMEILQDAIRRDVEVQQANVTNRRGAMRDELQGRGELFTMLRQQGMDDLEAVRAEEAAKIDMVQRQIEQLASQMGSQEARVRADGAIASLDMEKNKLLAQVAQHRDTFAIEKAKLANQKYALSLKAGGAGGGKIMPGQQVGHVAELDATIQFAKDRLAEFNGSVKVPGARFVPGTKAYDYDARRTEFKQLIGKAIEGGVLRAEDEKKYDKMIPEAGDFASGMQRWQALVNDLTSKRQKLVEDFGKAGYASGGLAGPSSPAAGDGDDYSGLGAEAEEE